ncbi:MAG: hypothetical protein E6J34_12520 [Chloroflexi bacterium]|nr:MAG: hypothetical protein E6J34_12520 [Chloroflexota bacterium]
MSKHPAPSREQADVQEAHLPLEKKEKPLIAKLWKAFPIVVLLALLLILGQGAAHAATSQITARAHLSSCNTHSYPVQPSATLQRNTSEVVHLQAVILNHSEAVDIWQNGVPKGEYYLPYSYGPELYIYYDSNGSEWVDACSNWTYQGS